MKHLVDLFTGIAPEAAVVMVLRIIFKLLTHAINDEERWDRLWSLVAPLLAMLLTLVVVAAWWLLADGGVQVLLHDFGRT